jgi:hypothetical protein
VIKHLLLGDLPKALWSVGDKVTGLRASCALYLGLTSHPVAFGNKRVSLSQSVKFKLLSHYVTVNNITAKSHSRTYCVTTREEGLNELE